MQLNLPKHSPESHPRDDFTVLRLSVRIPGPGGRPSVGNQRDQTEDVLHSPAASQLQSFELCFHSGFVADSDNPISLHFSRSCASTYAAPLVLPCPTPPFYVHEISDVVDLVNMTRSSQPSTSQSSSQSSHLPPPPPLPEHQAGLMWRRTLVRATVAFLAILALGVLFWLGRTSACDLSAWRHQPSGGEYDFHFDTRVTSVDVHARVLPAQQLRLGLMPALMDALEPLPAVLTGLMQATTAACRSLRFLAIVSTSVEAALDPDTMLVCDHAAERAHQAHAIWRRLSPVSDADVAVRRMILTSKMLSVVNETRFVAAYRKGRPDQQPRAWVDVCRLCDVSDHHHHPPPFAPFPQTFVPVADWHFACDAGFSRMYSENSSSSPAAVAMLDSWAKDMASRRLDSLRDPPLDVDGDPLYPNDQHPFTEADDVVSDALPLEGDILAMTRHLVELSRGVIDVMHRLAVHSTWAGEEEEEGVARSKRKTWAGLGRARDPQDTLDAERKRYRGEMREGIARLARLHSRLEPVIRVLGHTAAGMIHACRLSEAADLEAFLDHLEPDGHRRATTVVRVVDPKEGTPGSRTTLSVMRCEATINVSAEADRLRKHAEEAWKPTAEAYERIRTSRESWDEPPDVRSGPPVSQNAEAQHLPDSSEGVEVMTRNDDWGGADREL